ncbi:cytochrome P450 pisatin demethylase [Penicillium macrosclerotiorum]|uniref:cytochrome P450 pisatin demethylase n=1 Tax=Penicillium macrosclerotiorum TaxID=303699 RepID=UPI002549A508|nr:cytochrome P450 pisatin demethylase [Penicillium macrosclerotiorum]KAJ5689208.1 cytochrome P450 pisatin demethylase [Penicillium macrosclerotiorum]
MMALSFKAYAVYAIVTTIFILLLRNRFRKALYDIPGPSLAKYTKLWKLHNVWKGKHHNSAIALHRKHGHLVRIGPNHISVGDPNAIPIIYGLNKGFIKTAFYPIQSISWNKKPQPNLFSERDEKLHREQKRLVANGYSLGSLLEMESGVDSCSEILVNKLRDYADKKRPVDLGKWLQYYAFDVVGEFVFAKKLGFLEEGRDIDGMIKAIQGMLTYASLCGQVPELHPLLLGNPLFPLFLPQMETWNQVVVFTLKAINSRLSIKRDGEIEKKDLESGKDMMSKWLAIHHASPEKLTTTNLMVHLSGNVFAGSDTTAIAFRAIFYFLLQNPATMGRLRAEIDTATSEGKLSRPVTYKQSVAHLPYLGAVIKEAMRLHPSTGLIMEREVPKGGNSEVYEDPDSFIPERWLENSPEKLKQMEQSFFVFGAGARSCIGKYVSLVEMHKLIPELLREFEFSLHDIKNEWTTKNVWFVQQEGLVCDITRRNIRL